LRRKVIQYVPFADGVDEQGGHGTHVCGSILGNRDQKSNLSPDASEALNSDPSGAMDGMAKDAKIAFFDIGLSYLFDSYR
jgi:hypothetical protein